MHLAYGAAEERSRIGPVRCQCAGGWVAWNELEEPGDRAACPSVCP